MNMVCAPSNVNKIKFIAKQILNVNASMVLERSMEFVKFVL